MTTGNYDLIVIGSGAIGTFHAYYAASLGKSVLMLEKDARPVNATVRNFGMVIPSGMDGRWFGYGCSSTQLYKEIQQQFDISVRNNGTVYIASDEGEQTLLHELKARYDNMGYPCEMLPAKAVVEKYPAIRPSYAREALFFPGEISVEPNLMIHRLHAYMQATFPTLHYRTSTPVVACEITGNTIQVKVAGGIKYHADKVVLASGHECRLLFPSLFAGQHLQVCKLQMIRTAPQPALQLEGNIATGLSIRRYEAFASCPSFASLDTPEHLQELKALGIHLLFKKAVDGSVIIGDSHQYAPISAVEDLGYELDSRINDLMLKEAARIADIDLSRISECWAGYYSLHASEEIFEMDIEEKISIRLGIGGKGMTCSAGYASQNIRRLFCL